MGYALLFPVFVDSTSISGANYSFYWFSGVAVRIAGDGDAIKATSFSSGFNGS